MSHDDVIEVDMRGVYRRRRLAVLGGGLAVLAAVGLGINSLVGGPGEPAAPGVWERSGKAAPITIAVAGDTNAEGEARRLTEVGLGTAGEVLRKADLAIVNLETVVAADRDGLQRQPKTYTFVTGPQILDTLKAGGVDVVTAANNHGMDYGTTGLQRMLEVKAHSPVPILGIGKDDAQAWAPWRTRVKDRDVLVYGASDVLDSGFDWEAGPGKPGMAITQSDASLARLVGAVERARATDPDAVIVTYLHMGQELVRCPTPRQRDLAKSLARAGADVVVGSHAHILQGTATSGNSSIAYGMGNFGFAARRPDTSASGVLTFAVPGTDGAPRMDFTPATITRGVPVVRTGTERDEALASWRALGEGCA